MPPRQKATHHETRALNEGLVLRTLYDRAPVSRAEVARLTGLTRTTVSDVVGDLLRTGIAREIGRGQSTGGKAPILVEVARDARQVIGLDLGEQVFVGALVNLRGEVQHVEEVHVEGRAGTDRLRILDRLVDRLRQVARAPLLGIGIGTPGLVDTYEGVIRWAVNLDWHDLRLGPHLRDRTGLATYVANDAQAVAMGEYLFGPLASQGNLVAIKVGLGIGAGLVVDGKPFVGDGLGAGEIGHTIVAEAAAPCRCGRYGCLETVASSRAILRAASVAAAERPASVLGRLAAATGTLTLRDVADATRSGDREATRIVIDAARPLGQAVAWLIAALNIQRIVLIGSVTVLGEQWLAAVREEAAARAFPLLADQTVVDIREHHDNVVVLGACALLTAHELGFVPSR